MRTKLRTSANQSGLTVYSVIRNESDQIKDSTGFVTYNESNWADYDIALLEQGTSKYYSVTFPADITTVGWYHITYLAQIGGTPAVTDDVIFQELIYWNGQAITTTVDTGTSITDICNMALAHLGQTQTISNFETDTSEAAKLCRRFYATARDKVLRSYPWSFATIFATLGKVADDPTTEYEFSYRYPSDCLHARRILSGTRNETKQSQVHFRVVKDVTGRLIYTDFEDAVLEYTIQETNPTFYTKEFILAMSYLLAHYIAVPLTRGDQFRLRERSYQFYLEEIATAESNDSNEEKTEDLPVSEFERGRA